MRNYALWRAEHCVPLGLLEQLLGSTSFGAAVSSIIAIRQVGFLTAGVMLLWAISPIGGQSILRTLSTTSSTVPGNHSVSFLNPNTSSGFGGTSMLSSTGPAIEAIYTASLLGTEGVRKSPQDSWGFPKIPVLDDLPLNKTASGSNPWRDCHQGNKTVYSSLVGLVVQGIPSDQNSEFPVESSYFDLDCRAVALNIAQNMVFSKMGEKALYHNATSLFHSLAGYPNAMTTAYSSFFIDTSYNFTASPPTQSNLNLWFGAKEGGKHGMTNVSLFNCTMSTIRVESWIMCQNGSCAVDRMRKSEKDTRPSSLTPFNDPDPNGDNWVSLNNLITQFPWAAGVMRPDQPSLTDSYIYGDPSLFDTQQWFHDWSTVSEKDVSSRLRALFNTYWQAALAPFTIASVSPFDKVNMSSPNVQGKAALFNMTTATTAKPVTVYSVSRGWAAVFFISTILLEICAIASIVLKSVTTAPDILGYVSSMTRDNPYIQLPAGGSFLSGPDRARSLQHLPVQIVDVRIGEETGYIALASTQSASHQYNKLNRRREYL
ncbi:hypothetical protein BDV26DRAFT_299019 [Aspergillus bertholletiae]|uniref:Uncharacterized protein n=1 Tax=Aspergillus bertholletiae TaxID=1226010 RepID=A0A5N7AR10_9EURO|nr:hypothetical protein BDV26DRAFT_299019 [Aspergillus bertholletiae]